MKIKNLITKLDFLGKEVQFKIENYETYKTPVGGFLTILLAIISLGSIYLFGSEVFYKEKPNVLFSKNRLDYYPTQQLESSSFFFGMRIVDSWGKYVDDYKYFVPTLLMEHLEVNKENGELDYILSESQVMETCNTTHIDNKTLIKEQLKTYKCGVFGDNHIIGGYYDDDKVWAIAYVFTLCNADTEKKYNLTCASLADIEKNFHLPLFVETKFTNNIVDPANIESPINMVLDFRTISFEIDKRKKVDYFYSGTSLKTDLGLIAEEILIKNFTTVEKIDVDSSIRNPGNYEVFWQDLLFTKFKIDYKRSYLKAQDVAATVGGFFSCAYYTLRFIYFFYIENSLQFYYYERMFKFFNYEDDPIALETIKKDEPIELSSTKIDVVPFKHSNLQSTKRGNNPHETHKENNQMIDMEQLDSYNDKASAKVNDAKDQKSMKSEEQLTTHSRLKPKRDISRLSTIFQHKEKPRSEIKIEEMMLWKYRFCFCCIKREVVDKQKVKNQLMHSANYEIDKRTGTMNILSMFEQFKVLKQIVLNESQCFMIDNKGKKFISNRDLKSKVEYTEALELKKRSKEEGLIKYLKEKVDSDTGVEETDLFLLKSMEEEIRERVKIHSGIK
jgi:hypothetical protein